MTDVFAGIRRAARPSFAKWDALNDQGLGYSTADETGGFHYEWAECGSRYALWAFDTPCVEIGYRQWNGVAYETRFAPADGRSWVEDPGEGWKPGFGVYLFNALIGEVYWESDQASAVRPFRQLLNQIRTHKEASAGLVPVIMFAGSEPVTYRKSPGKIFRAPVFDIVTYVDRAEIPPFAVREPTVPPPPALDSQISFKLLKASEREQPKPVKAAPSKAAATKRPTIGEVIDDAIPDDPLADLWEPPKK